MCTALQKLVFITYLLLLSVATAQSEERFALSNESMVAPLDRFRECTQCPEMIVVPTGDFMMGAKRGESRNPFDFYGENAGMRVREPDEININPSEHPRHKVTMDIPYAIGRNEITHGEWIACVDAGACKHIPDHRILRLSGYVTMGPNHPVINVSYFDILEYIAWLNGLVGSDVYRLPTEAEWEYAGRAGTETRFAQGDELTAVQANFSRKGTEQLRRGARMPHLVDRNTVVNVNELEANNGWGIRHMSGNVMEITISCWSDKHLELATDGEYLSHALAQSSCRRVGKGGGYGSGMDHVRLARRYRPTEDRRRPFIGFRLVRELNIASGNKNR